MNSNVNSEQIKTLNKHWQALFQSNKLNVCTEKLEGATLLEVSILRIVGENPEIILREISKKLNVVSSTLTSAINRLEKRKLLFRKISNRDLRSFCLELTEEGRAALDEHIRGEEEIIGRMLGAFENDAERNEFIRLFKKIAES